MLAVIPRYATQWRPLDRCVYIGGSRDSLLVERRTRKPSSSNSGKSSERIFFSKVNFVFACSTPVLPQWHVKDPGHFVKSAGVRLHLNTRTPLTQ